MLFRDEYFFLSSFYPCVIPYAGFVFPSLEHAYHAAKFLDVRIWREILNARTPGKAKRIAKKYPMRHEWEDIKVNVMRDLIHIKFSIPALGAMLLATGNIKLVEDNWWHDTFWGVYEGEGQNMLGQLLMAERERLRQ